jgi:hypothetical protein
VQCMRNVLVFGLGMHVAFLHTIKFSFLMIIYMNNG